MRIITQHEIPQVSGGNGVSCTQTRSPIIGYDEIMAVTLATCAIISTVSTAYLANEITFLPEGLHDLAVGAGAGFGFIFVTPLLASLIVRPLAYLRLMHSHMVKIEIT